MVKQDGGLNVLAVIDWGFFRVEKISLIIIWVTDIILTPLVVKTDTMYVRCHQQYEH